MKRILLTAIFFILPFQYAWSYEVKLSCNLHQTISYSFDGSSEQKNYTEIIEVRDDGIYKFIRGTTKEFPSFSTDRMSTTVSIIDRSNKNKWDLTNVDKNDKGQISDSSIVIDRNTGKIYLNDKFTDIDKSYRNEITSGICVKIDMTKQMF
jgi:hypothetical protein